ncbi:C-C motif chemokine 4 homolog [Poeciliopsis prolifica]|uniref:C-C motif chemokine 4 homolog n=1 Tax=Poeciliopsis prolifica TaxID=188132 RepID=UPI0024141089|nr:C-C motif chemokine 4 homolog [Poeciliopsis prolifica]
MKAVHILLLCMLGAALLATVLCNNSGIPEDCCFEFFGKPVKKFLISWYYKIDSRCPKSGVVLMTLKGRPICANPNQPWVKNVMNYVDRKTL